MLDSEPAIEKSQILEPGKLWTRIVEQSQYALESGALLSIPTEYEFVEQDDVRFLVRVLSSLVRKDEAKQQEKKNANPNERFNPFLPYEEDLFVVNLSNTHLCLLNKFNVAEHHLLIITRKFEEQEAKLTLQDFAAAWTCLREVNGLVFYNAGKNAGASQRHKHLQLIPFPLTPEGIDVPIAPLLASATFGEVVGTIPTLPFVHAFAHLMLVGESPLDAAEVMLDRYDRLLRAVNLVGAYNLLVTREWMLLIPRSQESFASISINALGFAGTLFVRDQQQMQVLKRYSPMEILRQVGMGRFSGNR
ncbi:MAG: phosphorylase [Leptolyngbyaceae cyanobacterium CSU_1_3]|nr:phosphorylase [Leptolyngbyaceae cyanobacterium CSU_1_3]